MCLRVTERLVSILPVHRQRLKCSNSAKTFLNVFIVMSKWTPRCTQTVRVPCFD